MSGGCQHLLCAYRIGLFIITRISDGVLHVNSIYPGVQIVFSTDEGKNWSDLKESHRASLKGKVWLAANR